MLFVINNLILFLNLLIDVFVINNSFTNKCVFVINSLIFSLNLLIEFVINSLTNKYCL
jgi:hypothetical protein